MDTGFADLRRADSRQLNSRFMHLPRDVVLCIADHLPPESIAVLALTCRALWWESYWKGVIKDPRTRPGLLPLLVHDQPGNFYCFNSQRLHRIHENMRPGDIRYGRDWGCCYSDGSSRWSIDRGILSMSPSWKVSFFHAHLVMNAHRYGLSHGLHVNGLYLSQRVHTAPLAARRPTVYRSREARIISNELFICDSLFIRQPQGLEEEMRAVLEMVGRWQQIRRHQLFPCVPRSRRNAAATRPTYTRRCGLCLSEGEIDVEINQGQRGWVITAQSYH